MSQTEEQGQHPAPAAPVARKGLELFWRIIAGLMLIVIAWVLWVIYQISPRPVATPLAYEAGATSAGRLHPAAGASAGGALSQPVAPASAVQATVPAVPPVPAEPAATDQAMDQAQAAARVGAHQASADVQAGHPEPGKQSVREPEQVKMQGLKLSTEIATPPAANK